MKRFLFILIIIFCFFSSGCKDNRISNSKQEKNIIKTNDETIVNAIIDTNGIEKIFIHFNIFSSRGLCIDKKEEIEQITKILNSDKEQIFDNVEFSFYDVIYTIDIVYKEKSMSIRILLDNDNDNYYYFINDDIYIGTKPNQILLIEFISQKDRESIPEIDYNFIIQDE